MSALTFICWLDKILQSKMRFITWLLPVIVMMSPNPYLPTAGKYTLSLHSISLSFCLFLSSPSYYHYLLSPSLPLWLCIFLSTPYSIVLLAFPLRLFASLLSSPDSPPHLSVFLLPCLCASLWAEIVRHTWERTNYMGSLAALPQKNWNFKKHIPPIPLNLPRPRCSFDHEKCKSENQQFP